MADLKEIATLGEGWDGGRAKAITTAAVLTAQGLTFVPLQSGGIQIEMHAGGIDFEIEIEPTGKVGAMLYESGGG